MTTPHPGPLPSEGRGKTVAALAVILALLLATPLRAAQVSFNFTNNVTGLPDTNTFRVIPVDNYVESGGGFIVKGPPVRLTPKADGRITNSFEQGDYVVTNSAVSQGFIIRVPLDHGATIYNATSGTDNGGLALSGFNRYVTITYGTNLAPTFDEVTNALQLLPVNAAAVTNTANDIGSRITNGFTLLVYTNVSQVLYTNHLPALTNGFVKASITNGLATTNYVDAAVAAGGGGAASTNGLATTNYVMSQGFVTSSVTNGLATTNYVYGQSFVTGSVTNGLAPLTFMTNYVTTRGYVTSAVTNGLATTNYVFGQGFVTASVTNGLATTNYVNLIANTNGITVTAGNTFVSMVTNAGLVTISGVNQTNGMYRSRWTTNSDTAAIDGSTLINLTATNVSGSISNRWRQDATNAINANMLEPDLLTLYTNANSVYVNTTMIVATNSSQALKFTNANNYIVATMSNSLNKGTAFSSAGSAIKSEQFGSGASATAVDATTLGYQAMAIGLSGTAIGSGANISSTNDTAIGARNTVSGDNSGAFGTDNSISHANTFAIGHDITSSADNQFILGNSDNTVIIAGGLTVAGSLTNNSVTVTNLNLGSRSLFAENTNVVEVTGAGSALANGMYYRNAGWWTNSNGAYLTNIAGTHYIYSNAVTLYSSASLENAAWTQVSGALPVPASYKGSYVPGSSLFVTGFFAPTNLLAIINSEIGTVIPNLNGSATNTLLVNPTLVGVNITNLNSFNFNTNLVDNSYNLRAFGAVLDGEIGQGAAVVSNSTTITITNGLFHAGDVGKHILVYFAGTTYGFTNGAGVARTYTNCLSTTISAVTDSNTATMSQAANSTMPYTSAIWGTDDTAAWNSAIAFVTTNGGGTILVPRGISVISSPVQDPIPNDTDTNLHKNAQIVFPDIPTTGQVTPVVKIKGVGLSGPQQSIPPFGRQNSFGTLVVSTLVTNQRVALINCENLTTYYFVNNATSPEINRFGGRFTFYNNLRVEISDISFRFPLNPYYLGLDLRGCDSARLNNVFVDVGAAIGYVSYPQFSNSCAVLMPESLSAGLSTIDDLTIYGFRNGLSVGEHLFVGNFIALDCWNAVALQAGGHMTRFGILDAEVCHSAICAAPLPGSSGYQFSLDAVVTGENSDTSHWAYPSILMDDPGNSVYGKLAYENTDGTALTNRGAANMDWVYFPALALPRHMSQVRFEKDIQGPTGNNIIGINDSSNLKVNPPAAGGGVFINWDRGTGVNFGSGGGAIVAKVDTTGNPYFNGDLTNAGTATVGKTMIVSNALAIGDNLSFTNGNTVIGLADKTNVKLNPPATGGGVFINWDRGTGINFGAGNNADIAASVGKSSYQQATNDIANWPTAAQTGGGFAIVNSNATVYILTSTANSTAWAATNKLAGP